jgi:hypothetical protein
MWISKKICGDASEFSGFVKILYMLNDFSVSFVVFGMYDIIQRLYPEIRQIATVSHCSEYWASKNWFGNY